MIFRLCLGNNQIGLHTTRIGLDHADERVVAELIVDEKAGHAERGIAVDGEQDRLERRRMNERERARLHVRLGQELSQLARALGRDQVEDLDVAFHVLHHFQVDQVHFELRNLSQTSDQLTADVLINTLKQTKKSKYHTF